MSKRNEMLSKSDRPRAWCWPPCGGVAEVGEDERGHHGVEVDDAKHVAVAIEEDVVHLRVAVANALGQLAFAEEAFALGHFLLTLADFVEQGFHSGFVNTAGFVVGHSVIELLNAELDVVEILDRLAECAGRSENNGLEIGRRSRPTMAAFSTLTPLLEVVSGMSTITRQYFSPSW